MGDEDMKSGEHIPRDREKALDLTCMQVESHIAVGAGYLDHVGHQAGGDGDARLVFLIRASVAHIRDHSCDACS